MKDDRIDAMRQEYPIAVRRQMLASGAAAMTRGASAPKRGWRRQTTKSMTRPLMMPARLGAVARKRPTAGLLLHAARGGQYGCRDYRDQAQPFGMIMSISGQRAGYDNAPMASFSSALKNECMHHRRFTKRAQAWQAMTASNASFDQRQRQQARPGDLLPAAFTQQFYSAQRAA